MEVKLSAVNAFIELLDSVANGEEVLLLRSSDCFANDAMQTYNDALQDKETTEIAEGYYTLCDTLAEKFNQAETTLLPRDVPDKEASVLVRKVLAYLVGKLMDTNS